MNSLALKLLLTVLTAAPTIAKDVQAAITTIDGGGTLDADVKASLGALGDIVGSLVKVL